MRAFQYSTKSWGTISMQTVRFGPFEVDVASAKLKRSGIKLPLRKKSFDLLTLLLNCPGEIVARDALTRQLWPGNGLSNAANSLNAAVGRLRQVLGDSAETAKYIETVEGSGYRFAAHLSSPVAGLEQVS